MQVGMLWFDNDPRTSLTAKVERAAEYYHKKYGQVPVLCVVHPTMSAAPLPDFIETRPGKVTLKANRAILPGHLWIGEAEKD